MDESFGGSCNMLIAGLGFGASVVVFWFAVESRIRTYRLHELRTQALLGQETKEDPSNKVARITNAPGFLEKLGGRIIALFARRYPSDWLTNARAQDRVAVGAVVVMLVPVGVGSSWMLAGLLGGVIPLVLWWSHRSRAATKRQKVAAQLPTVVDLFRLAIGGGMNVTMAVATIAPRVSAPMAGGLCDVARVSGSGLPLAEAMGRLVVDCGEDVRPLTDALMSADRHGAPVSVALERLSAQCRAAQSMRAEQIAKKLSVQLLFPLAFCVLPAFTMLTVVPLLAGSFSTLASSFS